MNCFRFIGIVGAAVLIVGGMGDNVGVDADQPPVAFDVPAMLPMHELIPTGVAPVTASKIVEIVIPMTAEIRPGDRDHITEFRFDVSWNGHTFPVVDYGPKSQTVSHIDGTINIDQTDDKNAGLGFNANSDQLEIATLTGQLDLSNRSTARKTYREIPQHHPVIASGTILRGTGAFFRFHRSRTETLEGGREVVVAYRVARDWRGGLLNVQCSAMGQRKIFGTFVDDIEVGKSFRVPVYLDGDVDGVQCATEFVAAEQSLRRNWHRRNRSKVNSGGELLLAGFNPFGALPLGTKRIDDQWMQRLIVTGDSKLLQRSEAELPQSTAVLAKRYLDVREKLLQLGE